VVKATRVEYPGFFIILWTQESGPGEDNPKLIDKNLISSLWQLIEPILEPDDIELVEIEFKLESGRWILRLYIDTPGGITLEDCEAASKQVSALLDMEDLIRHPYHLEVSSPGINRVLRKATDFARFAGSPVQIRTRTKLNGRRNFTGTLLGVENSNIVLDADGARVEISPDDVDTARLNVPPEELFRRDANKGSTKTGD
jgi:ribosome maturation factor RimP